MALSGLDPYLMSFLEQALAKVALNDQCVVPEDLLDECCDDDGTLQAKFLLHPRVRDHANEADVRHVLEKKSMTLQTRVSSDEFVKLAGRVRRLSCRRSVNASPPCCESVTAVCAGSEAPSHHQWTAALDALVETPRWQARDEHPARFAAGLHVGNAEHASDVNELKRLGVTAVLNCAPSACEGPIASYEIAGIKYAEVDAEDFDDYPLLELHLPAARAFVDAQGDAGVVLIHCFAGVNRSPALALAIQMARERKLLLPAVTDAFKQRPFILSNSSFRRSLVNFAAEEGLLGDPPSLPVAELRGVNIVRSK